MREEKAKTSMRKSGELLNGRGVRTQEIYMTRCKEIAYQ